MEPPRPDVPADAGQAAVPLGPVRLTFAVAAIAVAAVARGPVALVAACVAVVLGSPVGWATAALAFLAACWRWGSGWLVALVGAQAVLGPAGAVGPVSAAASSWLGAAALVAAVPGGSIPAALAVGAGAGLLVAGPAGVGGIATRVATTLALALLAYGVGRLRWRRWLALAGLALAVAAAALA